MKLWLSQMQLQEHESMTDMKVSGDVSLGMGICDIRSLHSYMLLAMIRQSGRSLQ